MKNRNEKHVDDAIVGGAKKGRLGRITDRALNTIAVADDGMPVDRALSHTIKTARDLGSNERRQLSELVYTVVKNRRKIKYRLHKALKACGKTAKVFDDTMLIRFEVLVALLEMGAEVQSLENWDKYAYKRVPKLFEKLSRTTFKHKDFAVTYSLPAWIADRWSNSHGDSTAEKWAQSLLTRGPLTLRVNTMKANREEILERLSKDHNIEFEPTPRAPHGIIVRQPADIENLPLYREGIVEIQDEGSQLIVEAVAPKPGDKVFDACAGAGGKTLGLLAYAQGKGEFVAVDIDKKKLSELQRRAKRAGYNQVKTSDFDMIDLPKKYLAWADRVLVDTPCSGSGRLRRQPDTKWRLTEAELLGFAGKQFAILSRGVDAAKVGGIIIYATCSLFREENEAIVQRLLEENGNVRSIRLSDMSPHLPDEPWHYVEPGPDEFGPDGFFISGFQKIA